MSFAPMSIVISATCDRWAAMNASAAASWEPCRYEQGEPAPVSMEVLVSPGQPSFTSVSDRPNARRRGASRGEAGQQDPQGEHAAARPQPPR
jgi:hypothetical protein